MRKRYRIVNEPDGQGNWFFAEKRFLIYWRYIGGTISQSLETTRERFRTAIRKKKVVVEYYNNDGHLSD